MSRSPIENIWRSLSGLCVCAKYGRSSGQSKGPYDEGKERCCGARAEGTGGRGGPRGTAKDRSRTICRIFCTSSADVLQYSSRYVREGEKTHISFFSGGAGNNGVTTRSTDHSKNSVRQFFLPPSQWMEGVLSRSEKTCAKPWEQAGVVPSATTEDDNLSSSVFADGTKEDLWRLCREKYEQI